LTMSGRISSGNNSKSSSSVSDICQTPKKPSLSSIYSFLINIFF
jgi:hypothetical protein